MGPEFTAYVERLYERLPEHYRNADADQPGDFPFKRYLALLGDQAGAIEELVDRFDYVPEFDGGAPGDTSELVDPDLAELEWLPWLAQLVGVVLAPELTEAEARDAIRFASSGWRVGTKLAVADAAKTVLSGTKYAKVYDHSTDAGVGSGGEWDVLIVTRSDETADPAAVLATVIAKGAKPAGVVLHHLAYFASWGDVEADLTTWADWEAAGSWGAVEAAGL